MNKQERIDNIILLYKLMDYESQLFLFAATLAVSDQEFCKLFNLFKLTWGGSLKELYQLLNSYVGAGAEYPSGLINFHLADAQRYC